MQATNLFVPVAFSHLNIVWDIHRSVVDIIVTIYASIRAEYTCFTPELNWRGEKILPVTSAFISRRGRSTHLYDCVSIAWRAV